MRRNFVVGTPFTDHITGDRFAHRDLQGIKNFSRVDGRAVGHPPTQGLTLSATSEPDSPEHNKQHDLHDAILHEIPSLRRYARFLARDPDAADDLVQEALTRAVGAASSFRLGTNIRAWLFTILKNVVRNNVRRGRHNPVQSVESIDSAIRSDPADQPDAHLELSSLAEAIDTLPPSFKQVLLLCGVEGFLYEEAAMILDVPVGTVRSRLFRARNLLLKRIEARGQTTAGAARLNVRRPTRDQRVQRPRQARPPAAKAGERG
jgi:RNA polymerase sigma-70 factor, ECF subfamily